MAAHPVEIPSLRAFLGAIALKITTAVTTNLGLYKLQGGLTANDIDVRNVVNGCVDAVDALSTSGGAPSDASYVCLGTNLTLTNERVLTQGSAITITDAGAGSTCTVAVSTGGIVNSHVNAAAAIAGTKVAPAFGSQNISTTGTCVVGAFTCDTATIGTFTTGVLHSNGSGVLSSSALVNADVDAAAAVAGTKVSPDFGAQNIVTTGTCNVGALTATSSNIGAVTCTSVNAGSGAITTTGLATVGSAKITGLTTGVAHADADGDITSSTIVNADVNAAAAIAGTKISPDFGSQNITTTGDLTTRSQFMTSTTAGKSTGFRVLALSSSSTTEVTAVVSAAAASSGVAVTALFVGRKDSSTKVSQVVAQEFEMEGGTLATWGEDAAKTTMRSKGTVTGTIFDVRASGTDIIVGITPPSAGGNWEWTVDVQLAAVL